jgi:hypothetical protein
VTWYLLAPTSYCGINFDTFANQNFLHQMDIDGPYSNAICYTNSLSATAPTLTTISDTNMGATFSHIINVGAGNGLQITNSTIGVCYLASCAIVYFNNSWNGDATITNNWFHDAAYGIDLGVALTNSNVVVTGNRFNNITIDAWVNANASKFMFSNNTCGASNSYGGVVAQCYNTNATGTYYSITGNVGTTTASGGTSNSSPANGATGVSGNI